MNTVSPPGSCRSTLLTAVLAALLAAAGTASAQAPADPARSIRAGAMALSPRLNIASGLDSNILNEPDDAKSDLATNVSPAVDVAWRAGPFRLRDTSSVSLWHYRRYSREGSFNTAHAATLELRARRLRPFVSGGYLFTRDRPSAEIDIRPRHTERPLGVGSELTLTPKALVVASLTTNRVRFVEDATAAGVSLRDQLNRDATVWRASLDYRLTPLTAISVGGEAARDRFQFTPERDADSRAVTAGVDLSRSALIAGRARVGVRHFKPTAAAIPEFTGLIAAVDVGYTMRDATRLAVRADRDVAYSIDVLYPYFVNSSLGFAVTQRLTSTTELQGGWTIQRLAYRALSGVPQQDLPPRTDRAGNVSLGLGRYLTPRMRIGVNADYVLRRSELIGRSYDDVRIGTTFAYLY
jgi:hypothetical protein